MSSVLDTNFNPKSYPPKKVPLFVLIPDGYVIIDGKRVQLLKVEKSEDFYP